MSLPVISPPEHYSADAAYRLLRPIRPAIEAAQAELITGINARRAALHFSNINTLATKISEAISAGILNGSQEWSLKAQTVITEIAPILTAASTLEKIYAKRVGEKIASDAESGIVTSLEDAQKATILDQSHVDSMRALIDAVLA